MKFNKDEYLREFIKERDEAILSLDKEKILAYARKYEVELPTNELSFWAGIHKARLEITDIGEEEKEKSKDWLRRNGFGPEF